MSPSQLEFDDILQDGAAYVTVSRLTRDVKALLESAFPGVCVQGEISNFIHHSSGHMYFSLKDERAQIPCVMWRNNNQNLFFAPTDGMKVQARGRLSLYEKRGAYQLDIWQLQHAGLGDLQLAFERLKKRLHDEGLFAAEIKHDLPDYPERIGLVTSASGAALHDIVNVLRRRAPNVDVILNAVRVQGTGAANEIATAIDEFNEFGDVDVLIVGRGGGSLEDLWPFNEEVVARAVFQSSIPIISAVGHEIDFSICDFVADLRAATPSAAAELAVADRSELKGQVGYRREALIGGMQARLRQQFDRLRVFRQSYAFGRPKDQVHQLWQRLDELQRRMQQSLRHRLQHDSEQFTGLSQRLSLLTHENVLKRGYTLCTSGDGVPVTDSNQLEISQPVNLRFHIGSAVAAVQKIQNS